MTTAIGELLQRSVQAHQRYRQHMPHMGGTPPALVEMRGDPIVAAIALREAAACRLQAETDDPDHVSPAWANWEAQYPHAALVTFYAEQIARLDGVA